MPSPAEGTRATTARIHEEESCWTPFDWVKEVGRAGFFEKSLSASRNGLRGGMIGRVTRSLHVRKQNASGARGTRWRPCMPTPKSCQADHVHPALVVRTGSLPIIAAEGRSVPLSFFACNFLATPLTCTKYHFAIEVENPRSACVPCGGVLPCRLVFPTRSRRTC